MSPIPGDHSLAPGSHGAHESLEESLRNSVPLSNQSPPEISHCLQRGSPGNAAPQLIPCVLDGVKVGAQRWPGEDRNVVGLKHKQIWAHVNNIDGILSNWFITVS